MAATTSSGNPWKANNDPKDFVGCKIEIISNSDIRYVGTLYTFDPHASTISLKDVQSFGTESRRSGDQVVAPSHELYEYIVFRISDIKDLCVCEPPSPNSRRLSHVDSAIVSASDESQQTRSTNGFPRIRYAAEFMRSSWNENRGRSGSANNASTSSGNLGSVGGNNNNRNSGQQPGNNRSSNGNGNNNNNNGYRGGRGGGRGGNRGGMSGGFRGGYNNGGNNGRRGAPVFPYPSQAGPQDWLTRYQKDMNLKAEFQNVNPDLSVLANIASSSELPADKVRDMMEGNWEAFLTAAELPGKTEKAPTNTKAEYTDGFFDSLTAPPPTPNETMYNRRKDFETFGPANNNNNSNNGPNNNGRYNNNNNRQNNNQQSNQNQRQSTQNGGGWGNNNQGGQSNQRQQQQSGDGYGQNNSQGYGGRNNGGQGNYNNNGRFGNNNRGNQRGRGGNGGQQRGGYVSQRGGQRGFGGNLNSLLGSMNNGGGFTQRDLVIPAPSNGGSNWTFNQRTQAALWTPAVGLDLTQQPTSSTTWTFACNSPAISESGYDALSPSPVA